MHEQQLTTTIREDHRAAVTIDLGNRFPAAPGELPEPRGVHERERMSLRVQPQKKRFVLAAQLHTVTPGQKKTQRIT